MANLGDRAIAGNFKLKQIMSDVEKIPALPMVVAQVMQILEDPFSSAADLTDIISHDQAMMFRLLKIVNSTYYGFPRAIATVTESIVLLGFPTVRNLILTNLMYNFEQSWKIKIGNNSEKFYDQQAAWRHSVATAITARELLLQKRQEAIEHIGYLAGLLHDIGKTFFYNYYPKEYSQLVQAAGYKSEKSTEAEEMIMGASHGQVGAWMVERWKLPQSIGEPIAWHHWPQKAKINKELTIILQQADYLAHIALEPERADDLADLPEKLGLGENLVAIILKKVHDELKHLEIFMSA